LTKTRELEASRNEAISSQQAVLKADAEKRKLIQKMTTAVDDERKNISRHIHDELNSFILAVKFHARTIKRLLKNRPHDSESEQINQQADFVLELATALYSSLRNIVKGLRPEILEILGLDGALTDMVDQYNSSQSNCRITFQASSNLRNLNGDLPITVFRIIQEALSNIIKYAQAENAFISIDLNEQKNLLKVLVKDDGCGFDYAATTPGVGLIGMRERVVAFNGTIEIKTALSKGTEILITFPI
jgi:two-component system, NarL family, sensor histidine kinase UhpB